MASAEKRRSKRLAAHEAQGGKCFWCGRDCHPPEKGSRKALRSTAEHLIPASRGGGWRIINIVMACNSCNSMRGNLPLAMWLFILPERLKSMSHPRHMEVVLRELASRGISLPQVGHPGNGPDQHLTAASPPLMDSSPAP